MTRILSLFLGLFTSGTNNGRPSTSSPRALSMEDARMRANDSNPHPAENSAAPLIQAEPFLLTQNRREFDAEYPAWPSPSPSKPLFRGFEKPNFFRIAILTALCLITYPAFYFLTLVAKNKSLFDVRIIVSLWCSGVGFTLGYILLKTGAQHLEAASEFTLVGCPVFLKLHFDSLGHRDPHELRRWWNETWRSCRKLA